MRAQRWLLCEDKTSLYGWLGTGQWMPIRLKAGLGSGWNPDTVIRSMDTHVLFVLIRFMYFLTQEIDPDVTKKISQTNFGKILVLEAKINTNS